MANIIKKISIKTVCGTPEREVIGEDKDGKNIIGFVKRDLMQIVGICTSTRTGSTSYGDFVGLRGQFQATNLETGEEFRSAQCFLANDIIDLIMVQLSMENTTSVEFAFIISVKPSDAPIGFEYAARPLLETQKNDPIASIMKRIEDKVVANATKKIEKNGSKNGSKKGAKK